MSEWAAKRFWTQARAMKVEDGFTVHLDDRPVRSPAKAPLIVPTRAVAEEIAQEWQAQDTLIKPDTMPFTRAANSAIDRVTPQHAEVAALIADYGDSDLICYRAEGPDGLVRRQAEAWDPLIGWAADHLDASLRTQTGVMHVAQDAGALSRLRQRVAAFDAFELTAFHDLVALSGSLVLGFAACSDLHPVDHLWDISRIDENWQIEQWGADEQAEADAAVKRTAFLNAHRFYKACAGK